ncbi:hypothetical protein ABW19_dt0200591 [Dactylella cylindrospora]|nr:hypothetical protein ABW19_dt0200591 [Dactylella cylindrospora]
MKHHHHYNRRVAEQGHAVAARNDDAEYQAGTLVIRDVIQARATQSSDSSEQSCAPDDNSPRCEKPVSSSTMTLPIVLGTAIPIVAALIILFFLHRRHVRRLEAEDRMDKTKSMDFGMEFPPAGGKKKKGKNGDLPTAPSGRHKNQLSLDMDVAAPYLLPPELNNSRESLHSMSRVYIADDDKYKPSNSVHRMPYGNGSSTPSVNSHNKPGSRFNRDSSIYTASLRQHDDDQSTESLTADLLQHPGKMATGTPPARGASLPSNRKSIPELQVPEPAFDGNRNPGAPPRGPGLSPAYNEPRDSYIDQDGGDLRRSHMHLLPHIGYGNATELDATKPHPAVPELSEKPSAELPVPVEIPPPKDKALPSNPIPPRSDSREPPKLTINEESSGAFEGLNFGVGHTNAPEPPKDNNPRFDDKDANLPQVIEPEPQPGFLQPQNRVSTMGGLEVNYGDRLDPRRLSYGFRPLPPAAEPGEDAEERAMRIRSFYKEYFDDTNPGGLDYYAQAPEENQANYPNNGNQNYNNGYYYEEDYSHDYNQEYGDYYPGQGYEDQYYNDDMYANPQKPFAEPPTRRAMTPPPRAPPRFENRQRAGSVASSRGPPPPRSYSSQSNRYGGPTNRGPRGPSNLRKPVPPAEPLLILPSPHLLKEDAFASPIAFAPAPRSKEYRNGTESEAGSVRGGLRPYSPSVRAHTPLASAFDELSFLPTPHQLRKSGTYTALDFAPPRKFKNEGGDNFSDTGSIRSNRTGYSAAQNIRSGAYRVSRLPQDVVPTTDSMVASLKPSWNMHNN